MLSRDGVKEMTGVAFIAVCRGIGERDTGVCRISPRMRGGHEPHNALTGIAVSAAFLDYSPATKPTRRRRRPRRSPTASDGGS